MKISDIECWVDVFYTTYFFPSVRNLMLSFILVFYCSVEAIYW
ncbi:MAG: hypothetical protein RLZZ292_1927 [Bacteroidota bacterium]|jgi:hypothetical protein